MVQSAAIPFSYSSSNWWLQHLNDATAKKPSENIQRLSQLKTVGACRSQFPIRKGDTDRDSNDGHRFCHLNSIRWLNPCSKRQTFFRFPRPGGRSRDFLFSFILSLKTTRLLRPLKFVHLSFRLCCCLSAGVDRQPVRPSRRLLQVLGGLRLGSEPLRLQTRGRRNCHRSSAG